MASKFGELENVIPLIAPQDITTTATASPYVDLKTAHSMSFVLLFGNIAAASADQAITVTVECVTGAASASNETAIAFSYRKSTAVGANSLGSKTAATSSGVSVATTDDNKILLIDVDPAVVAAALADARYVRVVITPDAGASATLVAALAVIKPRYVQNAMVSAT